MRNVLIEREVRCSPDVAVQRILDFFEPSDDKTPVKVLAVDFTHLGLPDLGSLSREVRIELGEPERRSYGTLIPIAWEDAKHGAFPRFSGVLEIAPLSRHDTQISVIGRYTAPFGTLGAAFDAAVGHRVAEHAIGDFVDELARALEAAA